MKLLKQYYIIIIFVIIILIDYLGLYQWNIIKVEDISISKPFGYKYSSLFMDENSTFDIFKNNMGLRRKFHLIDNHFLRLKFKKVFLNQNTIIVFFKLSDVDKQFIKNKFMEYQICTKKRIVKKNNQYTLEDMIIYKSKIKFYIISDTKDDLIYFYKQMCE